MLLEFEVNPELGTGGGATGVGSRVGGFVGASVSVANAFAAALASTTEKSALLLMSNSAEFASYVGREGLARSGVGGGASVPKTLGAAVACAVGGFVGVRVGVGVGDAVGDEV